MKKYNDMKNSELADELISFMTAPHDDSEIDEFDKLVRVCAGRLRNFDAMKKARFARRTNKRSKFFNKRPEDADSV